MADLATQLSEAQKSLSELETRYATLVTKHENTENDLAFHKKRYESAVAKITAEKDAEIEQLKTTFAEINEKRKEAFAQLKEKLQQASVVVQRYAAAQQEHETQLQQAKSALEEAEQRAASAQNELSTLRSSQGDAQSAQTQRIASLEAELASLRSSSSSSSTQLTEAQTEIESLKSQISAAEDKAKGKPSPKCSINVEDGGGEPLFPGVIENGRSLVFKWSLAGSVRIQWYRSFRGGQFEPIPGKAATKPTYNVNIDDVGACLRAEATHTTNGTSVFAECGPIHPSGAMLQALTDPLKKLDATFHVESSNATEGDKQRRLLLNKEKIKLQDGKGKTVAKKEWSEHIKAVLDGDSDRRFSVQIEVSGPVVNYTAPNQRMRDLIVCSVRLFTNVILKHNGKLSKDNDHLLALSLYVRTLNETTHLRPAPSVPASRRQPSVSGTGASAAAGAKGGKPPVAPAGKAPAATPPRKGSVTGNQTSVGGASQGSAPSTPQSRSIDGSQHLPSHARKPSAVDDDEAGWGLPPAAVTATPSNGNAGGAAQVDADGFIVTKNRGFDDYAPKSADDSDPEDGGEGAEPPVQAIKVQINAEARAPATADSLKSSLSGISLAGPKKKGKKGDKKEKVGGKKKKEGEDAGAPGAPSAGNDTQPAADAVSMNSVPGLPPLAPQTAAVDNSDPFAEFFK